MSTTKNTGTSLPILSAAQEERLVDIANGSPLLRGTRASQRALERRGLVVFSDHAYRLTHAGHAVFAAIRERRALSTQEKAP